MRKLLLLLLGGAAVGFALSKARRAEAPAQTGEVAVPAPSEPGGRDLKATLERIRRHAQEALDAAHEAQEAKVAEMQRKFDEARGKTQAG